MSSIKKALVTTLRDADQVLSSFVHYHLQIGFDHLFLFFDDPNANIPHWVKQHAKLTAFSRDDALEDAWSTTTCFLIPQISRSIDSEAMARQILNAELALREAYYKQIQWLLHIDIDELFYTEETTVDAHFQRMEDLGLACISYPNLEGVTERKAINDYFREVSLFKINPKDKANAVLIRENKPLLKQINQIPPSFFHYYASHKSAVRVTPNTLPKGVHNFSVPTMDKYTKTFNGPVILHYPCCGIDHFIRKYKTLGSFGDRWFGQGSERRIKIESHLKGRDVVGSNDSEAIQSYYTNNFVFSAPALVRELTERGLCRRITAPAAILQDVQYV